VATVLDYQLAASHTGGMPSPSPAQLTPLQPPPGMAGAAGANSIEYFDV